MHFLNELTHVAFWCVGNNSKPEDKNSVLLIKSVKKILPVLEGRFSKPPHQEGRIFIQKIEAPLRLDRSGFYQNEKLQSTEAEKLLIYLRLKSHDFLRRWNKPRN